MSTQDKPNEQSSGSTGNEEAAHAQALAEVATDHQGWLLAREPKWTTGQGIGFLVALPGWVLVGLGLVGALVGAEAGGDSFVLAALLSSLAGLVSAIPGTIVFKKCKRPPTAHEQSTAPAYTPRYTPGKI